MPDLFTRYFSYIFSIVGGINLYITDVTILYRIAELISPSINTITNCAISGLLPYYLHQLRNPAVMHVLMKKQELHTFITDYGQTGVTY